MKKELKIKLLIVFICSLLIGIVGTVGYIIADDLIFRVTHRSHLGEGIIHVSVASIDVKILEIIEDNLIVKPVYDVPKYSSFSPDYRTEYEFLYTDKLQIDTTKVKAINCDLEVGKIISIVYVFKDGTTGENPIILNTV